MVLNLQLWALTNLVLFVLCPCRCPDINGNPFTLCKVAQRHMCFLKMDALYAIIKAVRANDPHWVPPKPQTRSCAEPLTDIQKNVHMAIKELASSYGETMPHMSLRNPNGGKDERDMILIPNALHNTKRDVWEDFLLSNTISNISYEYFVLLWSRYHWNIQLREWNPFAKCDTCVNLRFR